MALSVSITGGGGFVGQYLVKRHIEEGDHVRILTRGQKDLHQLKKLGVKIITGELSSCNILEKFTEGADILYHCAGEYISQSKIWQSNVIGTSRLINAATDRIGRWVELSSIGVYGTLYEGRIVEDSPLNPTGLYETSKAESDQLVIFAANQNSFSYSILRPTIIFGTGMPNKSLFQLIYLLDRGLFFFIKSQYKALANYIHVKNVVEALYLCGKHPAAVNQCFIVSDFYRMEEWISTMALILNRPIPRIKIPITIARSIAIMGRIIPGFPLTYSRIDALTNCTEYISDKIRIKLGYKPVIGLYDAIADLVVYYEKQYRQ